MAKRKIKLTFEVGEKVWLLYNNGVYQAIIDCAHLEVYADKINQQYDVIAAGGYRHNRVWASNLFRTEFEIYQELAKNATRCKEI